MIIIVILTQLTISVAQGHYTRRKYEINYRPTGTENAIKLLTRNTLDCDQSNYSSRTVFSHILTEFGPTRNSAIRSADPENPTLEPNMKWIGRPLAEIWPFEIFKIERSVVGRSVLNIYTCIYFLH